MSVTLPGPSWERLMRRSPPKLVAEPGFMGTPHIRMLGVGAALWGPMRRAAAETGCLLVESWGFFRRDLVVAGRVDQVNAFVELLWHEPEVERAIMEACADAR